MHPSILQFAKKYPDNDTCLAKLFADRFHNPKCPECKRVNKYSKVSGRARYTCICGKSHIFPKEGTIFQHSSTDLVKWFFAMYLFAQSRNGVSAKELERACEVTYKTAWRMAKEIRKTMFDIPSLQDGEVEADETVIGAPKHGKRGRGAAGKTIVFGTLQRGGKVQTAIVPIVKADTLLPHFEDHVAKGTRLITDELKSYRKIAKIMDVEHRTVVHGAHQYRSQTGRTRTALKDSRAS